MDIDKARDLQNKVLELLKSIEEEFDVKVSHRQLLISVFRLLFLFLQAEGRDFKEFHVRMDRSLLRVGDIDDHFLVDVNQSVNKA